MTRFQTLTVLSEQKIVRFGCLHESARKRNCPGQKVDLIFLRSQTCTLSRSKIRPVPPVPCKCKVKPCKFLSVQKFVRTRVNGALVRLLWFCITTFNDWFKKFTPFSQKIRSLTKTKRDTHLMVYWRYRHSGGNEIHQVSYLPISNYKQNRKDINFSISTT